MSQADLLLDSLTEEEIAAYSANAATEPHIVVNMDRTITIPDELKMIAVQNDHDIETVTFDCPRYWDEHDLSSMAIYINYECPDGTSGSYLAENVTVDESDDAIMHFTWTISRNVTREHGELTILVCIKAVDEDGNEAYHWNSRRNSEASIAKGMECNEDISAAYPDVITYLVQSVEELKQSGVVTTYSGEVEVE